MRSLLARGAGAEKVAGACDELLTTAKRSPKIRKKSNTERKKVRTFWSLLRRDKRGRRERELAKQKRSRK